MQSRHLVISLVALALTTLCINDAGAALRIYYDPLSGNVSFDTTGTRSGEIYNYGFELASDAPFTFRTQNLVRLTNTTFFDVKPRLIGEGSLSNPVVGLLTIGDVLPPSLSADTWEKLFSFAHNYSTIPPGRGGYLYVDVIGGDWPPPADFIYGRPGGVFDNRWDLVDTSTITWATSATLEYDPRNGHVDIKTNGIHGGYITGIMLESNSQFDASKLNPSLTPGPFDAFRRDVIFKVADLVEPGVLSLGEILPTGLSLPEVTNLLTTAQFFRRAGLNARNLDVASNGVDLAITISGVPEPTALAVAGAGLLGLSALRRRK